MYECMNVHMYEFDYTNAFLSIAGVLQVRE